MRAKNQITLGFLLLVLSLAVRLFGIVEPAPQPDERNWIDRAERVIYKLKTDPLDSTSRLGHPGLPPTLLMVVAQVLNKKMQHTFDIKPGDALYFDELSISRITLTTASALLVPIVFLSLSPILGTMVAFLGALLLALDPMMIGSSRLAHVDATLSLLVTLCVLSYIQAVRRASLGWKVISGLFWGLCILVKPTSVALIPALLLVRLFMERLNLSSGKKDGVFAWSDLLVLSVGQILMISLWTRYWYHYSAFIYQLKVRSKLATMVYRNGLAWQTNYGIVVVALTIVMFLFGYLLWKRGKNVASRRFSYHLGILLLALSFFLSTYVAFPQIYENMIRYWTWAVGLSGERHQAFGYVVDRLKWGYLDVLFSHFNPLLLLGLLLGILVALRNLFRSSSGVDRVTALTLLLIPTIWILLLNISSKQTLRYALPVIAPLYMLIALGLYSGLAAVFRIAGGKATLDKPNVGGFVVLSIGALQLYSILPFYPYYDMYFNDLTGGVRGALERGYSLPLTGQNEAIDYLVSSSTSDAGQTLVTTFGDRTTLEYTLRRRHPEEKNNFIFGYFRPESADYLLRFKTIKNEPSAEWQLAQSQKPLFTFEVHGTELLWIYDVPLVDISAGYEFDLGSGDNNTGMMVKNSVTQKLEAVANPGRDKNGYLFFSHGVKIGPGRYEIRFRYSLSGENQGNSTAAARFEFGSNCQKDLITSSSNPSDGETSLECEFTAARRVSPRVYWFGKHNLSLTRIMIKPSAVNTR